MPELINSIIRRFYQFLINHKHIRRSGMRLPLTVSLLDSKTGAVRARHPLSERLTPRPAAVAGYLHDISRTGLALVLPSVHFGNRHLIDCSDYVLRIIIQSPDGAVNIEATPVRFDKLEESRGESRYLIGARIMQMTDSERRGLMERIKQAKKGRAVAPRTGFARDAEPF